MLLHKKNIKLLAAAILFPWFMGSCIDEHLPECPVPLSLAGELPEGDYILSFHLVWDSDGRSRAGEGDEEIEMKEGDFVNGSHDEHNVRFQGQYALFFTAPDHESTPNLLVNVVPMTSTHYYKDEEGNDKEFTEEEIKE